MNKETIGRGTLIPPTFTLPVVIDGEVIRKLSTYVSPTPGCLPIIAFGNVLSYATTISEPTLALLAEAGINTSAPHILNSSSPTIGFNRLIGPVLSLAKDKKVKILVRWIDINSKLLSQQISQYANLWKSASAEYSCDASVGGWMLDGVGNKDNISGLGSIKAALADIWNRDAYVSLASSKSFVDSVDTSTPFDWKGEYAAYIQSVASSFKTAVWTNRFEAFHTNLDDFSIRSGYFQNLEMFRRLSYGTGRPWWGVFPGGYSSQAQTQSSSLTQCFSTISMRIRYEVHCLLAFGAKGLGWEYFFENRSTSGTLYNWTPINALGAKVDLLFSNARLINEEIENLEHIFLEGSVLECRFSKNRSRYNGFTIGLSSPMGNLKAISPSSDNTSTYGVLMSRIKNMGNEYTLVVNVDTQVTQKMKLTFDDYVTGIVPNFENKVKSYEVTLEPGEWCIFCTKLFDEVNL